MIAINGLEKKYGQNEVLKGVDLQVDSGKIYALLGPNGSGKTTLIKSILGMVVPDKGDILIEGKSVLKKWSYRENIDYLPQIANFPSNLTAEELIAMITDVRKENAASQQLIDMFALEKHMKKKLGNLSGGTKQKVNIVLAFMFNSPYIILDEPTTGLDPVSLINLKQLIISEKEKGKTILISSHIISFVEEIADEIIFILEGKVYFKGSCGELKEKTSEEKLENAIANLLKDNHD
ncbi:ABC transporter ATP-binding protein [Joostella sp.]|uniref:ABC transporter ATP-binding protein n=1 Tax=Joostella sp. TaxID=2231138 RepID=UPI003A944EFD